MTIIRYKVSRTSRVMGKYHCCRECKRGRICANHQHQKGVTFNSDHSPILRKSVKASASDEVAVV